MIDLRSRTALVLAAAVAVLSGCVGQADTQPAAAAMAVTTKVGGDDRNGEYLPAKDWMKLDKNMTKGGVEWGDISGVSAIDPNRVFVVTWGDKNEKGEIQ